MLAELLDGVWNVAKTLGPPALTSAVGVLLTREYMLRRGADGLIADHDRRARELSEDLWRWIADRDRSARRTMIKLRDGLDGNRKSRGPILVEAAGRVYRQVLHDYRDHATLLKRELDELLATEGRAHARRRQILDRPQPRLTMTAGGREILTRWRERADDDPSSPRLEPWLALLELSAPRSAQHGVRRAPQRRSRAA